MIGRVKRLLPLVLLVCLGAACGSGHANSHGTEIVLRAVPQRGESLTPAGMQFARSIIESRLDAPLTFSSGTVATRGGDELVVDFAGTHAPKDVGGISATGNLQFFDFEKDLAPPTVKN